MASRQLSRSDQDPRQSQAYWLGYKLHVTGTCHGEPRCGCPGDGQADRRGHEEGCAAAAFPNLITRVAAAAPR